MVIVVLAVVGWKFVSGPSTDSSGNDGSSSETSTTPENLLPGIIDIYVTPQADSIYFNDSLGILTVYSS